jgi:uncharacterized protein YejL (UPF0352 family)
VSTNAAASKLTPAKRSALIELLARALVADLRADREKSKKG